MLAFLLISFLALGQKGNKLSLAFHLQPEKTYYQDSYDYPNCVAHSKSTYNFGLGASAQYDLTKNIFAETGLNYISRKFITKTQLNQGALPPPHRSMTMEFVTTNSVSSRILELPVIIGLRLINIEEIKLYLTTCIAGKLLLNNYYDSNFSNYNDTYWKFDWDRYAINIGIGSDIKISENIYVSGRIAYSIINSEKDDKYLGGESQNGIPLTHKFLNLTLGVKISL
jgi:opacity protein-like surface antigen